MPLVTKRTLYSTHVGRSPAFEESNGGQTMTTTIKTFLERAEPLPA
jgi:hypothetical protein